MNATNTSGRIELQGDALIYSLSERELWRVPVAEIRVVGEYTNTDGPADDYFFVFMTDALCFEASFYAEGRDKLLADLSTILQHELSTGLCFSTSLASRVLWPAHLEGQPLFELVPVWRPDILSRLLQYLLPRVDMHFTEDVKRECESHKE